MELSIEKADYNSALSANSLLTKLIQDEKKYDDNINENCTVKSLYENFFDNDDVCLLLAKKGQQVVGYIYGYIENNGNAKLEKVCVLDALYVEEDFRNKDVAKSLIKSFKGWARTLNICYIELKVCKENLNAINLYEKEGFKTNKIIMNYKVGDDNETF